MTKKAKAERVWCGVRKRAWIIVPKKSSEPKRGKGKKPNKTPNIRANQRGIHKKDFSMFLPSSGAINLRIWPHR